MDEPTNKRPVRRNKRILIVKRRLTVVLVFVAILAVCFAAGALWSQKRDKTEITTDLISQRLSAVSELSTVEYHYTNMGKFENQADFYGWTVPFTKKSFIVSYDGTIKAGIDATAITSNVKDKKITVTLPEAKVLSHEIDEDSIEVFDETKNIFNQIEIEDYTGFCADQKSEIEQKAIENGLLTEAGNKSKKAVEDLLKLALDAPEEYEIVIE